MLVLAALWALSTAPSRVLGQVTVEALELHLNPARGAGALTEVIPVRNDLDRAQQVRVSLGDWSRDSLGRNVFLEAGAHPASCHARLQVFPMSFQMAPRSVEYARVTVAPAADSSGCWSIVFFETVVPPAPNPDRPGSFIAVQVRTGVKVYVHAEGAARDGEISFAEVARVRVPRPGAATDSVDAWQADYRFVNTGTAHLKVRTSVEIRDRAGALLHTITAPEAYLTPQAVRDIALTLPDLVRGDYVAIVLADFGGEEITAARVEFRVP